MYTNNMIQFSLKYFLKIMDIDRFFAAFVLVSS
jgi:hypothetical protein